MNEKPFHKWAQHMNNEQINNSESMEISDMFVLNSDILNDAVINKVLIKFPYKGNDYNKFPIEYFKTNLLQMVKEKLKDIKDIKYNEKTDASKLNEYVINKLKKYFKGYESLIKKLDSIYETEMHKNENDKTPLIYEEDWLTRLALEFSKEMRDKKIHRPVTFSDKEYKNLINRKYVKYVSEKTGYIFNIAIAGDMNKYIDDEYKSNKKKYIDESNSFDDYWDPHSKEFESQLYLRRELDKKNLQDKYDEDEKNIIDERYEKIRVVSKRQLDRIKESEKDTASHEYATPLDEVTVHKEFYKEDLELIEDLVYIKNLTKVENKKDATLQYEKEYYWDGKPKL